MVYVVRSYSAPAVAPSVGDSMLLAARDGASLHAHDRDDGEAPVEVNPACAVTDDRALRSATFAKGADSRFVRQLCCCQLRDDAEGLQKDGLVTLCCAGRL